MNGTDFIEQLKASNPDDWRQILIDAVNNKTLDVHDNEIDLIINWVRENSPQNIDFFENTLRSANLSAPPDFPDKTQSQINAETQQQQVDSKINAAARDPKSEGGSDITASEAGAGDEAGASKIDLQMPRWILDQYQGPLSTAQKDRVLQQVELYYGQHFGSWEDLMSSGFLDDATKEVRELVDSAVYDTVLEQAVQFGLPSGDMFTVKADDWKASHEAYGLDPVQLASLVKTADRLGMRDANGKLNWQPFLALLDSTGLLNLNGKNSMRPTVRNEFVGGPGSTDMGITPLERVTRVFEQSPDRTSFTQPLGGANPNILRGEGLQIDNHLSARDLANAFQDGLQKYGDQAMAFIYAQDPALAGRIDSAGGDPGKIRPGDLQKVAAISSKLTGEPWWAASGVTFIQNYLQLDAARLSAKEEAKKASTSAGSTTVRQQPDPAALNETLRTLYENMFLQDPDEQTLARFRQQITAAVGGMQEGESVDVSARAQEFARQDPLYKELYGNKPGTVPDDQYRNQFLAGQQSMLGNEVGDNQSALIGMRSGKYQSTIGAAAGTAEAWDNSTFLGRLAHAAQVVGEMT